MDEERLLLKYLINNFLCLKYGLYPKSIKNKASNFHKPDALS